MEITPESLIELGLSLVPTILTLLVSALVLGLADRWLIRRHRKAERDGRTGGQLAMLGLTIVAMVALILSLPLAAERQGQLLSLLGLLLSGAIALSSTNILGNIMSGFMLRAVEAFRLGDFIRVGEEFGRVSERGLFHIELQTPEGELTTLPNTWMVDQPVRVLRSSGTVISAQVSLGYDVSRQRIETLLVDAASQAGLEDPFVHVVDLGDFSVTYRAAGMLRDLRKLLPTRSRLRGAILDTLHGAGIEIASPVIETHRAAKPEVVPVGGPAPAARPQDEAPAELFDKADAAALRDRLEALRERLQERVASLEEEAGNAGEDEREQAEAVLERTRLQLQRVEVALEAQD